MKSIVTLSIAFVAVAFVNSIGYSQQRDAGSKIRGDAYEGTSNAFQSYARNNYRQAAPVAVAPVATAQPQQSVVRTPAATSPPVNATAGVDNTRSGTRTFSVEPQAATAPATTYRTYAPRRGFVPGFYRADRKIRGDY